MLSLILYTLILTNLTIGIDCDRARLDIEQLDKNIQDLQVKIKIYEMEIKEKNEEASRWQFEEYDEARAAWKQASKLEQKIKEAQEKIKTLEADKAYLLKECPNLN